MSRSAIWKSIVDTLSGEIAEGHYRPGDKLPTEAQLASRFGVNRHTVRHAIGAMAEKGMVHSRRGSGVFVAAQPTEYRLGRRVRFQQNISATGQMASRKINRIETRPSDSKEAEALGIPTGDPVHVVEGVSLADGAPLAAFRSVFPAHNLPNLPSELALRQSITQALAACGVDDYTRAQTRLTAKLALPVLALTLQIKEGAPVLRSVAINVDARGRPLEYGITWFAGDRVTLLVTPE